MKNMKKKISFALAILLSVSVLATGCKKTEEEGSGLTEATTAATTTLSELTQMTTEETTTAETTTETTTETTEETTVETTSETTEETTVETSETSVSETSETSETTIEKTWSETEIDEIMYVSNPCHARKVPKYGAESVGQYKAGQKVRVIAHTDTGYYKLEDGSFIHADYLTEKDPSQTTTKATVKTTAEDFDDEEVIYDDDYTEEDENEDSGSSDVQPSAPSGSYTSRYGYKTLSNSEKQLYANIVKAAENMTKKVTVPDGLLSDDIMKVYGMVYNQEPQLFWLSRTVPSGYGSIRIDYTVDSIEERDALKSKIEKNAKAVVAAANQYSSTFSKLKVFYDWIVTNAEFSVTEGDDTCSISNGMTGGYLQCAGYAKTLMYLCDLAGIECMVITGKNDQGSSHAWNVVYCDNGYYNIDPAWGDPTNDHNSKYVRYNFFLVPDAWIVNDHLSVNKVYKKNGSSIKYFEPPACTKSSANYFKAYNKEFDSVKSATQGMYDELKAAIKAGKNVAHIRVTDKDIWDTLLSNDYAKAFQKYAKEQGNVSKLSRQKTYADGVLVVQYDIFYN